jgi:hypothetical protein
MEGKIIKPLAIRNDCTWLYFERRPDGKELVKKQAKKGETLSFL